MRGVGAYFLTINGFSSKCIDRFIREMENFAVAIADNIIDRKLLKEIITSVIYEDSYSEELLLKIINSYEKTDSSIVHVEYKNIIESIDKN